MRSNLDWGLLKRNGQPLPTTVVDRMRWYDNNVATARLERVLLQITVIFITAATPVAAAAHLESWLIAALGATATALLGLTHLLNPEENWIRLSATLVAIQGEIVAWSSAFGDYSGQDANQRLENQIEKMVLAETGQWTQLFKPSSSDAGSSSAAPQGG